MGALSRYLRVPRPRTFLYLMSLRTGVEMVSLSVIFNKLTGFFGLLAILTGVSLSLLQLSMYIYSVGALALIAFLFPHIRKQSPFECLALAWFYILDTVINTAFTSAFAITWFLAVSAHNPGNGFPSSASGASIVDDTAGFTSPKNNASKVGVSTSSSEGITEGQEAVANSVARAAASPSLVYGVGIEESIPSIIVVAMLTLVRVYFIFVTMAYARQVLRQHMYTSSSAKLHLQTDSATEGRSDNPFAAESPAGAGWRGKVGRTMVTVGESYWLGGQAEDDWVKGLDGRFKTSKLTGGPPGTLERERRARSGTGPPLPKLNVDKA